MDKCACKFYETDLAAQKEAGEWDAGFYAGMNDEQLAAFKRLEARIESEAASNPVDKRPLDKCGEFCKYLISMPGFPGETLYCCSAAGNKHIIDDDFNVNDVI